MFWLRSDKPDEQYLIELIDYLKSRGEFASTIRDGLRLVHALRQCEWDVLFEMFPALGADIDKRILEAENAALRLAAARPIQVIQQQAQAIAIPEPPPSVGPRKLLTTPAPPPVFDDDDEITLDIKAVQNGDSTQNFVNSVLAFVKVSHA